MKTKATFTSKMPAQSSVMRLCLNYIQLEASLNVINRNTSFFKVKTTPQRQWYILLWILPASPGPFSWRLNKHDDANNLNDDLVMPKHWHHLCMGLDGVSTTLHGVLVKKIMELY